jgi:hypothetical protein
MTELRLRSRTVSEIVDAAFALYRRDFGQYVVVMAVATVPQLVFNLLVRNDPARPPLDALTYLFFLALVGLVTSTIGSAAIMKLGSEVYLGEDADLEATVKSVIPRLGSLIVAAILKAIALAIGVVCLFVGALYVAARLFAVDAAIILENKGPIEAFGRSSELSDGRKGHILLTLLLVGIIYILLAICATAFAGLAKSPVFSIIASSAFTIVAYPMFGLTQMVLYYDTRIRGEGFDLERMAASIDGAGGTPGMAGGAP